MSISNNSVVSMHYELKDAKTNEVLDSNINGNPLSFIMGKGQIIPGLETQISELQEGAQKQIEVSSKEAYGEYDQSALQKLPKEQFAGIELAPGMTLYGQGEKGETVQVTVKEFTEDEVTVDFNHPLAGKNLLFDINITEVRDATDEELQMGVVGAAHSCCGGGSCGEEHSHKKDTECCGSGQGHNSSHGGDGSCCGSH